MPPRSSCRRSTSAGSSRSRRRVPAWLSLPTPTMTASGAAAQWRSGRRRVPPSTWASSRTAPRVPTISHGPRLRAGDAQGSAAGGGPGRHHADHSRASARAAASVPLNGATLNLATLPEKALDETTPDERQVVAEVIGTMASWPWLGASVVTKTCARRSLGWAGNRRRKHSTGRRRSGRDAVRGV